MGTPVKVRMPKTSRAKWNSGIYSIDIDASSVFAVTGAIELAVSPVGLMMYLQNYANPYFADQIADRFGYGGDSASGPWLPLSDATVKIRHGLGFTDDFAINERTQELLTFVLYERDFDYIADGASMDVPGRPYDTLLEKKLYTAQRGWTQGPDEMIPGAFTPARPVLAVDANDMAALLWALELHIINFVAGFFAPKGTFP
jgi:hypothetical protein